MNNFYTGAEAAQRYSDIVPVYQEAFAGDPWYEVSKCVDSQQRCPSGSLGPLAVGVTCDRCTLQPTQPAYTEAELVAKFDELDNSRPVSWYLEEGDQGLLLAALAWPADARVIASEKYAAMPAMRDWLTEYFGDTPFVWVDEVFAARNKRPRGNLQNFEAMCRGFGERLDGEQLAYRTIAAPMLIAPQRRFGKQAQTVLPPADRRKRSLVTINLAGEAA